MQAIEFETQERNGIINIPKQFLSKVKRHHLKIVMMYQEFDEIKEKDSLAEFTGMWKDRDISVSDIRKKAWE